MNLAQHKVKILVILPLVSSIVLGFGIYQFFYAPSQNFSGSIAFAWSPWQQDIVNGTLWINVTWTWQTENLSMTIRVNDDDLNYLDYLGFTYDKDNNGVIDQYPSMDVIDAIGFFPYNKSWSGIIGDSGIGFYYIGLQLSKFHTCLFTNETGYEFKISLPKKLFNFEQRRLIHLCYCDRDYKSLQWSRYVVSIEFEA
jgi:hypothetical protein